MSWFSRVFSNNPIVFPITLVTRFRAGTGQRRVAADRLRRRNSAPKRTAPIGRLFAAANIAGLLLFSLAGQASAQTFFDGTFNPVDWTASILTPPTNNTDNTVTVTTMPIGGFPGAWRQTQQNYFALDDKSARSRIFVAHINGNASYDPALGEILNITYSADTGKFSASVSGDNISGCDGYRLLLLQNDTYYRDTENQDPCGQDFTSFRYTHDVSQDVFERLSGEGPEQPDFSCNGSPIQFGYLTANQSGNPFQTNLQTTSGIDNWRVELETKPCRPTVAKLTINKIFENSNGNMPSDLTTAVFPVEISGCSATPSSITLTDTNSSATANVNVGETCTVTEQPPTGVTLPSYCGWQTTYNPGQQVQILASGNSIEVINKVSCDPPFSTEHFQCYSVEQETPLKPVRSPDVVLEDQFGITKNRIIKPRLLCAPVDKDGEGMNNKQDHLVFYELERKIPVNKLVEVENQFGTQRLRVLDSFLLGVPSLKTVIEEEPKEVDFGIEKTVIRYELSQTIAIEQYTLSVTNEGSSVDSPPYAITVTDNLPAGLFYTGVVAPGWTCLPTPSSPISGPVTITCTWAGPPNTIPPGPMGAITINVFNSTGAAIQNCAIVEVNGAIGDINPDNDQDCLLGNDDVPDLSIDKEAVSSPCIIGQSCVFLVTISNSGAPFTGNLQVTDTTTPAGLNLLSVSPPPSSCVLPGSTPITCSTGTVTITQGNPLSFTATLLVPDSFSQNWLENCVKLFDGAGNLIDESCAKVEVTDHKGGEKVDLGIRKHLVNGPLQRGGSAKFEITVFNNNGLITGPYTITVQDTLPPGFTFGSNSSPWNCSPVGGNSFTCTLSGGPPLQSGWSSTFYVKAMIGEETKGGRQCATVGITQQTDVNSSNDETCIDVVVDPRAGRVDLGVEKQLLNGSLQNGDTAQFEITVTNYGNQINPPYQITVPDFMPPGFAFVSNSPNPPWNCGPVGAQSITCLWTGTGTVPSGPMPSFVIEADISGSKGGRQCAAVGITPQTDVNPSNDETCIDVVVDPRTGRVDLDVHKRPIPAPVNVGDNVTFAIAVENHGGAIAVGQSVQIVVADELPPGFAYTGTFSSSNGLWNCVAISGQIECTWTGGTPIPQNSSLGVIYIATVVEKPDGRQQCAEVNLSGLTDVNLANNKDCIDVAVIKPTGTGGGHKPLTPFACVAGLRSASSNLNMRNEPSGNARILQKLGQGTALTILERKGDWSLVQVIIGNNRGPTGWVATRFLRSVEKPNQCTRIFQQEVNELTKQIIPNQPVNGINLGDDLTNSIIGTILPNGSVAPTDEGGFACVIDLPRNDPTLNFRSEPSGRAKIIGKFPSRTALTILERKGDWSLVQVIIGNNRGPKGWVATKFLRGVEKPNQC